MIKNWPVLTFLCLFFAASFAQADGGAEDLKRLMGGDASAFETGTAEDGIIRITPDKTKIVRLDQDAVSVVVANPDHASVILDSPRLLIIMPRQPGTTSFMALNSKGETILEKTVIVSSLAKPHYVRVRRVCSGQDSSCVPVAYFYCPDGCYEISPVAPAQGSQQIPPIVSSGVSEESNPDQNSPPSESAPAPSEEGQ